MCFSVCQSPGLLDFAFWPLTLVVSYVSQGAVDSGEVRFANIEEVRAHTAHWHFSDVSEGLADGTAEDEHAHLLVESRNVGVPYKRLGSFIQKVDPVAFPNDDLEKQNASNINVWHGVSVYILIHKHLIHISWVHSENVGVQ